MKKAWLLFLCGLAFAASSSLFGQVSSGTATIAGVVTDPTGAVVPGADVLVRNVGTNVARALKSTEESLMLVEPDSSGGLPRDLIVLTRTP